MINLSIMKSFRNNTILFTIALCFSSSAFSQLYLPAIFSDHMVLQQQKEITFWGWADVNEMISVTASWDQLEVKGQCSHEKGRWQVKLKTPVAGGPYSILVKGKWMSIELKDILIGEVWICSGQSNMEFQLPQADSGKEEIAKSIHPPVRFFKVPKTSAENPQDYCFGKWSVSNGQDMNEFSAVGYYFARKLSETMGVPVGMINASWGGSPIEAWIPAEKIEADSFLLKRALQNDGSWSPILPGSLWNAMVYPVSFYPVAGGIWYQGEANVMQYETYSRLMEIMISSWRSKWETDFPFYFVQIAPYTYRNGRAAFLREQQTRSLQIPKTGIVVTGDLVPDTADIHPKKKQEVGYRLAGLALTEYYAYRCAQVRSPLAEKMEITKKGILVNFMDCPNGLKCSEKTITGFEIAGADGRYFPATARIEKGFAVLISAKEVKEPRSVRYCFHDAAVQNLFSVEGLPVNSFRIGE
jgi:sialate O-acetylesterase